MILVVLRHAMVLCHVMDVTVIFFFCVSSKEKCDGSDVVVVIKIFDVMCERIYLSSTK